MTIGCSLWQVQNSLKQKHGHPICLDHWFLTYWRHDLLLQVLSRPMFGAFGKAGSENSVAFVSKAWYLSLSLSLSLSFSLNLWMTFKQLSICHKQAALEHGVKASYGLTKRVEAVGNVRKLTKLDMKLNDSLPNITVDPETYTVKANDEVLTCTAAPTVPLSRNYFLF